LELDAYEWISFRCRSFGMQRQFSDAQPDINPAHNEVGCDGYTQLNQVKKAQAVNKNASRQKHAPRHKPCTA